LASADEMMVPSGMVPTGRMLPTCSAAFFAGVDEHAGVHSFDCDEVLSSALVPVGVSEDDLSERCSSA
jgi:hypothetical protein